MRIRRRVGRRREEKSVCPSDQLFSDRSLSIPSWPEPNSGPAPFQQADWEKRAVSVVGVTEHQCDSRNGRCHLGDGVLPGPLTSPTHYHQLAVAKREAVGIAVTFGPYQASSCSTQGDRGDRGSCFFPGNAIT